MKALGRIGIASLASLGILGGLTVAVNSAWHPVRPRVLCTMPLGTGETAVYFGYTNDLSEPFSEPLSPRNAISSWAKVSALPVQFMPGNSGSYPDAAFVATYREGTQPVGETLTWTLGPRQASVNENTPRCDVTPPPTPPKDVVWVKPEPIIEVAEVAPEPPPVEIPPEAPPETPPPPPEPKAETPPPPKAQRKPPPQPKPKPQQEAKPPEPAKPDAPVALSISGLSNVGQGGMAIQSGENDSLGRADVAATRENTAPRPAGDPNGVEGGTGTGPARKVVRVPAKVKVRPKGEWPSDAPPRAGAVLVRLSLLVGTDGRVKDVKVVRKAGGAFDREARLVGLKAVFEPATVDGVAVESWVPWDVEFTPDTW